jgi:hypothetical protein
LEVFLKIRALIPTVLLLGALASGSAALAETITDVLFVGPASDPTITITGTGFGSAPSTLFLSDVTDNFNAGQPGDGITLDVSSYTNSAITFQFNSFYTDNYPAFDLAEGDNFTVGVGSDTFSGNVDYTSATPEPSVLLLTLTGVLGVAGTVRRRLRNV